MTFLRALPIVLLLFGCDTPPPSGQVVARVDGVDITRRDVLIELIASGATADVDVRTAQPALLDRIVVRKLLAAEAHRRSIDRSPEFLGEERRSRETILGDQLVQRVIEQLPPPSPAAIARFVAANRERFDRRQIVRIDRITLAGKPVAGLAGMPSNDQIADHLRRDGTAFTRRWVDVDSMSMPPAQLTARSRPVVTRTDYGLEIDQVAATTPAAPSPADRVALAAVLMRDQAARETRTAMIARLRNTARIDYAAD